MTIIITLPSDSHTRMAIDHLESDERLVVAKSLPSSTGSTAKLQVHHPRLQHIAAALPPSWSILSVSQQSTEALSSVTLAQPRLLQHREATQLDNLVRSPTQDNEAIKLKLFVLGDWAVGKSQLLEAMMADSALSSEAMASAGFSTTKQVCDLTLDATVLQELGHSKPLPRKRSSSFRKSFSRLSRRSSKRESTVSETLWTRASTHFQVELIEDSQKEAFQRLRASLFVPGRVDIFAVCFAVDATETLQHAQSRWLQEVEHVQQMCRTHGVQEPHVVLVGTKADLRASQDNQAVLMDYNQAVPTVQACLLAKRLNIPYFETGYVRTPSPKPSPTPGQEDTSSSGQVAAARQLINDASTWMKGNSLEREQGDVFVSPRRLLQHAVAAQQAKLAMDLA
eukprot:m.41507 g.41507  ORF g.41507 m.41507 type:complete len:396 (-) comp12838_c0_seq1:24-1211(-)